jgi:hypothetical protein
LFPKERNPNHFFIYLALINHLNLDGTSVEHFTRLPFFKHSDLDFLLFVFVFVFFTLGVTNLAFDFRGHFTRLPFFQHIGSIKPGISKRVE